MKRLRESMDQTRGEQNRRKFKAAAKTGKKI
jgi:hypothetical protein